MATDPIRERLLWAEAYVRRTILAFEDDLVRALGISYAAAARELDAIVAEAFSLFGAPGTWSITDLRQPQRQAWLYDQLFSRMAVLNQRVQDAVLDGALNSYTSSYYARGWTLSQVLPSTLVNIPLLPEQAALAAITFPYIDAGFFERFGDMRVDFVRKLRRSITASQVLGETMPQARKRVANELGWDIRRRTRVLAKANKGNFARAEMLARTEMLRSSNLGAAAIDDMNADILRGWEWITARDDLVGPDCAALDGRVFRLGERARPPLHPNGRCSTLPVLKSARELGLPEIETAFPPRETYRRWAERTGRPSIPVRPQRRAA